MKGELFCYRGGLLNGGRLVMLEMWSVKWRQNGHVMEVDSLKEGESSLRRWPV